MEDVAESTPTRSEGARATEVKSLAKCKLSIASAKRVVKRHPSWDDNVLSAIACGSVYIGMTAAQARAGWGTPDDINRSTYSFGVHEQWVYGEYGERGYLYFEDGILTSIQN
jgi:hypothetical protein